MKRSRLRNKFLNTCFEEHLKTASVHSLLHDILIFRVHVFHFYKQVLLHCAIERVELMTREAVSFEEVFH